MKAEKLDLYQRVTDTVIAAIENNPGKCVMPWHRPASSTGLPMNATTAKSYNGVNILSLWITEQLCGYTSNQWATFKQWKDAGAQVRKDEKGTLIVFYKNLSPAEKAEGETDENGKRSFFVAKASWVFNRQQVDNAPDIEEVAASPMSEFERLAAAEQVIKATGANIQFGGHSAFYRPSTDQIQIPNAQDFMGTATSTAQESFYSTILHELGHWTGAKHRLDRQFASRHADKQGYAREELVAELTAAFLCAEIGITNSPVADHAQYLASWLSVLKSDKRAIFTAATAATAAAAHIMNYSRAKQEVAA